MPLGISSTRKLNRGKGTQSRTLALCLSLPITAALCIGPAHRAGADTLYVSDYLNDKIYTYTPGGVQSTFTSNVNGPTFMAFDSSGNLFAGDAKGGGGRIYKFTPSATRTLFANNQQNVGGLAFDSSGTLFAADNFVGTHSIWKYDTLGNPTGFGFSGLLQPYGLAFDKSGMLFVADFDAGDIFEYTPGGVKSTFATGMKNPMGLAFDSSGNLFVSDYGANTIYSYTPGGVQSTFATGLDGPSGIAFDSGGDLFVADNLSGNVYDFAAGGGKTTFASGISPLGLVFAQQSGGATSTPEPGSMALAAGVLVSGFWLRRRKRRAAPVRSDRVR